MSVILYFSDTEISFHYKNTHHFHFKSVILLDNAFNRDQIQIYSCGSFEMAETAFVKGYAGALGGHEIVLNEIIKDYPDMYRFLDGSIMTANLGVAFSKDNNSDCYQKINNIVQEMLNDGTISDIIAKYSDPAISGEVSEHAENE